jgi:hypothetical protein
MIYESYYWKDDLISEIRQLKSYLKMRQHFTQSINYKIEKFYFITAFVVRKLIDSNKISNELESMNVPIRYYKKNMRGFDRYFVWNAEAAKYYDMDDLDKCNSSRLNIKDVLNMLIHSYFFQFMYINNWKDMRNCILLFNSDKTKDSCIYLINLNEWIEILGKVCNDHVKSITASYDDKSKKSIYTRSQKR